MSRPQGETPAPGGRTLLSLPVEKRGAYGDQPSADSLPPRQRPGVRPSRASGTNATSVGAFGTNANGTGTISIYAIGASATGANATGIGGGGGLPVQ